MSTEILDNILLFTLGTFVGVSIYNMIPIVKEYLEDRKLWKEIDDE